MSDKEVLTFVEQQILKYEDFIKQTKEELKQTPPFRKKMLQHQINYYNEKLNYFKTIKNLICEDQKLKEVLTKEEQYKIMFDLLNSNIEFSFDYDNKNLDKPYVFLARLNGSRHYICSLTQDEYELLKEVLNE